MNFEPHITRQRITSRGGGIEIDLTDFGFEGERMSAYQNYLGGGMLGRVCSNDTVRAGRPFVEESIARELDTIADNLRRYYHQLTNPEGTWESTTYEQNQKQPSSAY